MNREALRRRHLKEVVRRRHLLRTSDHYIGAIYRLHVGPNLYRCVVIGWSPHHPESRMVVLFLEGQYLHCLALVPTGDYFELDTRAFSDVTAKPWFLKAQRRAKERGLL